MKVSLNSHIARNRYCSQMPLEYEGDAVKVRVGKVERGTLLRGGGGTPLVFPFRRV